jgi:drug/metabolite transporter (DMT)-like permease
LLAKMSARASGWMLIAVSAASFGALGVLVKLAYGEGVDKYAALAVRFAVAAAILAPLAALRRSGGISAPVLAGLLLFGGGGYVAHSLCYFTALEYASPGLVGLLLYLYPALVALSGRVLFGERLGGARLAAIAVALAGTALTVGPLGGRLPGVLLALACAVIYGAYIVACSRLTRGVDPVITSSVIIAGAAVSYVVIAVARGSPLPPTAKGWIMVGSMAVISTVIAIAAFFAAMRRIGATSAAVGSTLEPLVTVALSFAILDERLSTTQLAGGAMIVAAVAWLATRPPASSP